MLLAGIQRGSDGLPAHGSPITTFGDDERAELFRDLLIASVLASAPRSAAETCSASLAEVVSDVHAHLLRVSDRGAFLQRAISAYSHYRDSVIASVLCDVYAPVYFPESNLVLLSSPRYCH